MVEDRKEKLTPTGFSDFETSLEIELDDAVRAMYGRTNTKKHKQFVNKVKIDISYPITRGAKKNLVLEMF